MRFNREGEWSNHDVNILPVQPSDSGDLVSIRKLKQSEFYLEAESSLS
jgi:hypothetical protein